MCGQTSANFKIQLREMMYGSGENFDYMQCAACNSLYIEKVPSDLTRFYPADYYSFQNAVLEYPVSRILRYVRRKRTEYRIDRKDLVGKILTAGQDFVNRQSNDWFSRYYSWDWFRTTGTTVDSNILDVGCGSGQLLSNMRDQGFTKLTGIDPFLKESKDLLGIKLVKGAIHDLDDRFDLVMAHHSFEHMHDPMTSLERMRDLCRVDGWLLLRFPVLGDSWNQYRECWVELDAPRHLFIPSVDGFRAFVSRVGGLKLRKIEYDTTFFEIAGSELYRKNIPLREPSGSRSVAFKDYFSSEELEAFKSKATALNAGASAGRASFYLQRIE